MGESSRVFIPVDFVSSYQSPSAHGLITTYFAVALVESLPTDLPLTPNLRRPNRRTEIFKQILNTLLVAPERFAERNNGIKITARGVEIGELDSQRRFEPLKALVKQIEAETGELGYF